MLRFSENLLNAYEDHSHLQIAFKDRACKSLFTANILQNSPFQ